MSSCGNCDISVSSGDAKRYKIDDFARLLQQQNSYLNHIKFPYVELTGC